MGLYSELQKFLDAENNWEVWTYMSKDLLVDSSTPRLSLHYFILRKMEFTKWFDKLSIVPHANNSYLAGSNAGKAQRFNLNSWNSWGGIER